MDTFPPSPELVDTEAAARIWGCSASHLRTVMRAYGVEPVREYVKTQTRGGVTYMWNPAAVLQVRRAHHMNKDANRQRRFTPKVVAQRRTSKIETERQKLLAKIAARHGITVAQLHIDNANGIVYR